MASADTLPPSPLELQGLLEKKATFQRGARALAAAVATSGSNREYLNSLFPVVQRCFTLLKTRHSNADFFRTGQQLFDVCARFPFSPEQLSKVKAWQAETHAFLADHPDVREPGTAATTSSQAAAAAAVADLDILDLLMNPGAAIAALGGARQSHLTDAGIITDDMRLEQQRAAAAAAGAGAPAAEQSSSSDAPATQGGVPSTGTGGNESDAGGAATGHGTGSDGNTATGAGTGAGSGRAELQRQILEGIQAIYSGMEAVTRGTEAIERELGSVLEAMHARMESSGKRKPPPASKKVLAQSREVVSEAWLGEHPDAACAVCFEAFEAGDDVVVLPCVGSHAFHAPCVKPWFSKTNSCPVCRSELPSEDPHYDAAKEREKEEAEERAGAANAVSHNEFMYI